MMLSLTVHSFPESQEVANQGETARLKGILMVAFRPELFFVVLDAIDEFGCFENTRPLAILCTEGGQE